MQTPYEIIIGLEVHVQLQTKTKLFCRCSTAFGAPPNTQTCPVCIGLPGALPVMNREAFRLALKAAVALNCEIPSCTKWDRKNYYYPDLPKGYQISQYDLPLSRNGFLEIRDPKGAFAAKRVGIIRAHLEEDVGKSMHDEVAGKADSRIDLNRAGTPLLEIVTRPDMRAPQEAKAFLTELKLLLTYLGVSDCNMQEGSLRVDANVNLHLAASGGEVATPLVEVKNMNSFRAVERALAYEAQRQYAEWLETGRKFGEVSKQTRGWDDESHITRGQRHKEESSDYRYFPDPDLVPVLVPPQWVDQLRSEVGELPAALRARLETAYGIDAYAADVIVSQGRGVVHYFERLAQQCGDGKRASNWIQQDILRVLNERNLRIEDFPVPPESLAELLRAVQKGDVDNARARGVFQEMVASGKDVPGAMRALGIGKVDPSETLALCREILLANPRIVADLQAGKEKAVGALVGQLKKRNANISPGQAKELFLRLARDL